METIHLEPGEQVVRVKQEWTWMAETGRQITIGTVTGGQYDGRVALFVSPDGVHAETYVITRQQVAMLQMACVRLLAGKTL